MILFHITTVTTIAFAAAAAAAHVSKFFSCADY
jgi:hypothetical protein